MADRSSTFAAGEGLRRLCWAYVRRYSPNDREDLVQDALIAVLEAERAGRVRDLDAAYDVARQRMFNRSRAERRYNSHVGLQRERLRRGQANRQGVHFERIEYIDISTYLDGLPPRERRVVELRLWGPMTSAEVARETGMTPSAVKNLYMRAVARLRGRFGDHAEKASPDEETHI